MTNQNSEFEIQKYNADDMDEVIALWEECGLLFPGNDPVEDIRLKVSFQPDLFLVGKTCNNVAATLMAGYDGHRGWLNYFGVLPAYQGLGFGTKILKHAIKLLQSLECPKINLQIRNTNLNVIEFYKKAGFAEHNVSSMQMKLR